MRNFIFGFFLIVTVPLLCLAQGLFTTGFWKSVSFSATGGTVTNIEGYRIHTFTSSGTLTVTGSRNIEILAVAGGGGGKNELYGGGGGGGGGGVVTNNSYLLTPGIISVTVGAGGGSGLAGENSVFGSITAIGGGTGGNSGGAGSSGGSGGGGGTGYASGGSGTAGQGNGGGTGSQISWPYGAGGGGGGAGSAGANASGNTGGSGGNGITSSISGTSVTYGGGGGGGTWESGSQGTGGTGGGGNGGTQSGTPNTGGGGGGGSAIPNDYIGRSGGSGIIIVRYPYRNGSTLSLAGKSCKSIKDNYASSVSGIYWIDPNEGSTSDAFQAYCEMTTNSGGWTLVAQSFYNSGTPSDSSAQGTLDLNETTVSTTAKLSDIVINQIGATKTYLFKCDSGNTTGASLIIDRILTFTTTRNWDTTKDQSFNIVGSSLTSYNVILGPNEVLSGTFWTNNQTYSIDLGQTSSALGWAFYHIGGPGPYCGGSHNNGYNSAKIFIK